MIKRLFKRKLFIAFIVSALFLYPSYLLANGSGYQAQNMVAEKIEVKNRVVVSRNTDALIIRTEDFSDPGSYGWVCIT